MTIGYDEITTDLKTGRITVKRGKVPLPWLFFLILFSTLAILWYFSTNTVLKWVFYANAVIAVAFIIVFIRRMAILNQRKHKLIFDPNKKFLFLEENKGVPFTFLEHFVLKEKKLINAFALQWGTSKYRVLELHAKQGKPMIVAEGKEHEQMQTLCTLLIQKTRIPLRNQIEKK
jgi:hypothetical protein